MSILANALPGFRDLRAPLTAGYMWLVFTWVLLQPSLDERPNSAVGGALYDLGADVGRVWVAIAVGTLAYLAGSVSLAVSLAVLSQQKRPATRDGLAVRLFHVYAVPQLASTRPALTGNRAIAEVQRPNRLARVYYDAIDEIERLYPVPGGVTSISLKPAAHPEKRNDLQAAVTSLETLYRTASMEYLREGDLPATLLVGDKPELFAEVDRLRAEGDLRVAVVLPLAAFIGLLVATESAWWALGAIPLAVLLVQGIRRINDSRRLVFEAVETGKINSPAIDRFAEEAKAVLDALDGPRHGRDASDRSQLPDAGQTAAAN